MKLKDVKQSDSQHSDDWYRQRMGMVTGSCVGKLMGKPKGAKRWSETAITYMLERAYEKCVKPEILNNTQSFKEYIIARQKKSVAMEMGSALENDVRRDFSEIIESQGDIRVESVGSIPHKEIPYADSPDDVIVDNGTDDILACVEYKCPQDGNFMRYKVFVRENKNGDAGKALKKINKDYYYQCQAHMDVTDTKVCYFVFYNEDVTDFIGVARILRDQDEIDEMHKTICEAAEVIEGGCESLYEEVI